MAHFLLADYIDYDFSSTSVSELVAILDKLRLLFTSSCFIIVFNEVIMIIMQLWCCKPSSLLLSGFHIWALGRLILYPAVSGTDVASSSLNPFDLTQSAVQCKANI